MRNRTIRNLGILLAATLSTFSAAQAETAKNPQVGALIKKGITQVKEKDYHQAINSFNEALTLDPSSFDGYVNRGWTWRQIGDFEDAIADYSKAINLQSNKSQVYLNRGWCHKRLNHMEDALKDFNKAIELDPKYINAYRNRGSLKLKMGDYQGAVADFNQLLFLDPDAKTEVAKYVPKEYVDQVQKLDPKTTEKIGTQLAQAFQGTSLEISDSELAKLNNRAARAIKAGDFASAITVLEDITKKKPKYKYARENLTTAYNNQGLKLAGASPEQSAEQFRKALFYSPSQTTTRTNLNSMLKTCGKDPESDLVRIGIGDELKEKGDYRGAFVEYMEALRLNNEADVKQRIAEVCALVDRDNRERGETQTATSVAPAVASTAGTTPAPAAEATGESEPVVIEKPIPDEVQEPAEPRKKSRPIIEESVAPALSLNPIPRTKIGEDIETYQMKWHQHVVRGDELFDQGNYVDAEVEYKESLLTAKKLGDTSQQLIDSLERVSRIFLVQRRPVEALSLLEQAYSVRKESQESDPAGLERLGNKVLALRTMLYPEKKDKDAEKEEDKDDKPEDSDMEEKTADAADGRPGAEADAKDKPKRSRLSLLKRKKLPVDQEVDSFELKDRPSAYSDRPSFADFQR